MGGLGLGDGDALLASVARCTVEVDTVLVSDTRITVRLLSGRRTSEMLARPTLYCRNMRVVMVCTLSTPKVQISFGGREGKMACLALVPRNQKDRLRQFTQLRLTIRRICALCEIQRGFYRGMGFVWGPKFRLQPVPHRRLPCHQMDILRSGGSKESHDRS